MVGLRREVNSYGKARQKPDVKMLISMGKEKGYLTYDEVNDILPPDVVSPEHIDDLMVLFGEMDIELVDTDHGESGVEVVKVDDKELLEEEKRSACVRPEEDIPMTLFACTYARWARFHCWDTRGRGRNRQTYRGGPKSDSHGCHQEPTGDQGSVPPSREAQQWQVGLDELDVPAGTEEDDDLRLASPGPPPAW